jgi:hypothetical protein
MMPKTLNINLIVRPKIIDCGLRVCSRCGGNILRFSDEWVVCLQCGCDYTPVRLRSGVKAKIKRSRLKNEALRYKSEPLI